MITTSDQVIVTDENALSKLFSEINTNQEPGYTVPNVDFGSDLIIALFMGEKTTGGFSIHVENIIETSSNIEIVYKEKGPKPTDMVTMAITHPYCIIKIKKPNKEIKFLKTE